MTKVGCIRTQKKVFSRQRPGWRPSGPEWDAIRRRHPRIHFYWSYAAKQWAAVEHGLDGHWHPVMVLGARPSARQVMRRLNFARLAWAQPDEFLAQLDAPVDQRKREVEYRAKERINEGSERLWRALSPVLVSGRGGFQRGVER